MWRRFRIPGCDIDAAASSTFQWHVWLEVGMEGREAFSADVALEEYEVTENALSIEGTAQQLLAESTLNLRCATWYEFFRADDHMQW